MSSPILVTKLFIPTSRPEIVRRPRLIECLDAGLNVKLTLISAPAGFGKTSIVTEWLNAKDGGPSSPFAVAWVSLDKGDNDLTRFLTYFVAAINQTDEQNTLGDESLAILQSPQISSAEVILTPLINEITRVPEKIICVLDDYHLIDSQSVNNALAFLLENLPHQLHLVITTREDPLLPLSRLRSRGQLNELRAADLRFTTSEVAKFLNQVMGLNLSGENIAAIETRTEGWIAGLQLAALSMQGRDDAVGFIQSFTGSNRLILDYLVEEVLEQQPPEIQTFLLKTAILDRLNGSLCNSIVERQDSQETLESLDRANLFIIPLDNERKWYRYHHLFAELLEQRLKLTFPDLINTLHAKAVVWYESNGYLPEAIQHAFAGGDAKTAVRLIEKGALDALERSDFAFILNAMERIPDAVLENSPWLFVYLSWALFLTGHIDIAAQRFENTNWLLDALSDADQAQQREMRGYIAGLKVQLAAWQRDYTNIKSVYDQTKTYLPNHHWILGYCAMMMGVRCWDSGNLAAATAYFREADEVGAASGNKRVAVTSAIYLGHALELEGHLQQAVQVFQEAFYFSEQDGRELPVACYLHIDLARVLYELNQLDLAYQHLMKGIKQSQLLADDRIEDIAHGLMTRVNLATEDFEKAAISIRDGKKFVPSPGITYDMRGGEYPEVRLWLKQKKYHEIERWLEENSALVGSSEYFKIRMSDTMYARANIILAREFPENHQYLIEAKAQLAELFELAENNGWGSKVIEILVLQALMFDVGGEKESALLTLEQAINLAEPEGYVRVFVDEGPPMGRLLYEISSHPQSRTRGTSLNYVQCLLTAFPKDKPEKTAPTEISSSAVEWIEPLSDRELDVLQLIAEGLTNQEIATKLYLSLNTVKAHTRNIYSKLAVNSRTQATARAQQLGLFPGD